MASKDIMASLILTIIFIIFISDLFKDDNDIKDESDNNKKILTEIEIILSKYSK
jgi:hypothetical protein